MCQVLITPSVIQVGGLQPNIDKKEKMGIPTLSQISTGTIIAQKLSYLLIFIFIPSGIPPPQATGKGEEELWIHFVIP